MILINTKMKTVSVFITVLFVTLILISCSNTNSPAISNTGSVKSSTAPNSDAQCNYGSSSRYLKCKVNLADLKETPVTDGNGHIKNLKFSFIVDPKTSIPDGQYTWNGCWLHSLLPHQVYWTNDNLYHNVTEIGPCAPFVGIQTVNVRDNRFDIVLYDDTVKDIVKEKLDGPFLLFTTKELLQYRVNNYDSITYTMNVEKIFNYIPKFEEDKEYAKNNVPYEKMRYYKTKDYNYKEFDLTSN